MFGVAFRGFRSVMLGMQGMTVGCHCMVCGLFSCSGFVVLGRFAVVLRGRRVVLGSAFVVFCNFGCGGGGSHRIFLLNLSNGGVNSATLRN